MIACSERRSERQEGAPDPNSPGRLICDRPLRTKKLGFRKLRPLRISTGGRDAAPSCLAISLLNAVGQPVAGLMPVDSPVCQVGRSADNAPALPSKRKSPPSIMCYTNTAFDLPLIVLVPSPPIRCRQIPEGKTNEKYLCR